MKKLVLSLSLIGLLSLPFRSEACTGITLHTTTGHYFVGRTIEWGGSLLQSRYAIVPRGYEQYAMINSQGERGLHFRSKWGYVGLSVEQEPFVVEGINEKGLSMGLFYFPNYGSYAPYESRLRTKSISDLQLVSYVLGAFSNVEEAMRGIRELHIVGLDPRASTVHWRIADKTGRQVVLEIQKGELHFYENPLGVLTNSPDFPWQLTNLNNYVHLGPGGEQSKELGRMKLTAFGAGSGMFGLPGDVTPPSRFVRASLMSATAPVSKDDNETMAQAFHILNNFDIPIGVEFDAKHLPKGIPSATQWTTVTDLSGDKIYYKTMFNGNIRCIDLNGIDFSKVKYQSRPLDNNTVQPVEKIQIEKSK